MKILITDFLFVEAHRMINMSLIKAIAISNHSVSLMSVNGYYDDQKEELQQLGIQVIDKYVKGNRYGKIKGKLYIAKLMKITASIAKSGAYDLVISLAFDTIANAIGAHYFNGCKIALFNHKNIDELANPIHKRFFNTYKNKFIHFVFEEAFKDYLVSSHNVKHVYYIPHPVPMVDNSINEVKSYDCVALCNSNDEQLVQWLGDHNDLLNEEGLSFLVRTKNKTIVNMSNINFLTSYLDYSDYDSLIKKSKAVFVPLPSYYKYRLSGSIYDALSRNKPVITTSKFHSECINSKYPGACYYVEKPEDIIRVFTGISYNPIVFKRFVEDHTINAAAIILKNVISSLIQNCCDV